MIKKKVSQKKSALLIHGKKTQYNLYQSLRGFSSIISKGHEEKKIIFFLLTTSFLALFLAYISQYIFGFEPCILCIYQRIPFFTIFFLSVIILFLKQKKIYKFYILLSLLALLINILLAFYHSGVEKKIFVGPANCSSSNLNSAESLEELEKIILKTKAVRCDEPQFYVLKLSMANWNLIYCLVIFILLSKSILTKNQNNAKAIVNTISHL